MSEAGAAHRSGGANDVRAFEFTKKCARNLQVDMDQLVRSEVTVPSECVELSEKVGLHLTNYPYEREGDRVVCRHRPTLWDESIKKALTELESLIRDWARAKAQAPANDSDRSNNPLAVPQFVTLKWAWESMPASWVAWGIGLLVTVFLIGVAVGRLLHASGL